MNPVSENIRMRCRTNLRTTGCTCEVDAAAIERLVQAAEALLHEGGWQDMLMGKFVVSNVFVDKLDAALVAFRDAPTEAT